MLFNLHTCVWTNSHEIIWILLLMCWYFVNVITVCVDCSSRHQRYLSHDPCCNNHRTCLILIYECWTCYRTLYDVTTASKWTAQSKVVHVLLCCVFLAMFELIPFNLELTFTSFPLQSVRTSHTPSLTMLHQSHPRYYQSYLTYLCVTSWSRHYLMTHSWDSYTKRSKV